MNFNLMPSLQRLTAIKIATTLWSQNDIIALMANCSSQIFNGRGKKDWQKIENEIIRKVLEISYPEIIKGKIIACIKPVGLQILKWILNDLIDLVEFQVAPYLGRLTWTPQGTLDKKKSAETLINDPNVDITIRYKLACVYCIEDDILKLWNKMSEDNRKSFYYAENKGFCSLPFLAHFWTYHINDELDDFGDVFDRKWDLITPFQFAFEYVAKTGNKPATEYFLQKLTPGEIQQTLTKIADEIAMSSHIFAPHFKLRMENYAADVLCFLLSQMVEEDQIKLLQRRPHQILEYFLDWPWQSRFMEMANYMRDSLRENNFYILLEIMVDKAINGYKDFDYQNLFRDFWQSSSSAHKRYVIDMCASECLLLKLLRIKDKNTIRLILRNATNIERRSLIFCDRGQDLCQGLIVDNEWDLLEFFVKESVQSNDEINVLKYTFKEHIRRCCSREDLENNNEEWNKFFKLLNDLISVRDKSAETSDSTA